MRCLLVAAILSIATNVFALGEVYEAAWGKQLYEVIAKHPRYVWGGSENVEKGLDCSGYLYYTARRAGFPVQRTTSLQMSRGNGGWIGSNILFRDSEGMDVVWWTFKTARPNGHLGVLIWHPKHEIPAVTHASATRGVVCDYIQGSLLRDITATRRLTIGDTRMGTKGH